MLRQKTQKVDYVIISAMSNELDFLKSYFSEYKHEEIHISKFKFNVYEYHHKKILLASSGVGTAFAAFLLTFIYNHFHPEHVFITGTAGGIHSQLKLGDVVVAEKAFEAEMQNVFQAVKGTPFESCLIHPLNQKQVPEFYAASPDLLELTKNISVDKAVVVTSNAFPAPLELFEKIKQYNPYFIDMETSAFYQTAWILGISILAVRGISNILNHDGTDENIHQSDLQGSATAAAKIVLRVIDKLTLRAQPNPSIPELSGTRSKL